MIRDLEKKVLGGDAITVDEARRISSLAGVELFELFSAANRIRHRMRGERVDVCSIINAKSGLCAEDCAYCAQSKKSSAGIQKFPLVAKETILERAMEAKRGGARRFCIVTSGRRVSPGEIRKIASAVSEIRALGLLPCATLGLVSGDDLLILKNAGLERYHHNLETSERFFPEVCSTHSYQDKMSTIHEVKSAGLSLCSGGLFGLGETWDDRISMAFALREIEPDSVPINFLIPIQGTRLASQRPLAPLEALKIIALCRFILPSCEIRVCGGRLQTLGELNAFIFFGGADGVLSGNYLTTAGGRFEDDQRLIRDFGLSQ